jgi:ABC-type phosphate/phosphonate transport system substrate-binding protein
MTGRNRLITGGLLAAIAFGLVAAPRGPVRAAGGSAPATVRVGLVGSLFRDTPEPLMQVMMRPFKTLLEAQTGVSGQIVAGGDAAHLGRQLKDDEVQLGVFHGFEFAWARQKTPGLKPLLLAVAEKDCCRACLVVRADSDAADVKDLRGKAVALPKLGREHCRLFLERRVAPPDAPTEKCFHPLTTPADAEEALDAVVNGDVQAAVVDGAALRAYGKLKPGCSARLKTLVRSEPFPSAVVAYFPGTLPDDLLERFRDGMIAARSSRRGQQLLEMCRIRAFESVPEDYEQTLTAIAKAYPPPASMK